MQSLCWVRTNEALECLCRQLRLLDFIALDTEFVRERTFYPITGLIQLSTGQHHYLLDPLTITDWTAFALLLSDEKVIKVVHACGEDLEVLQGLAGVLPQPLYDTQLAAAFVNLGFSLGYSRLTQHFLGVELAKEQTRSDWLQRPLTAEQEQYAVQDVSYLAQLYPQLDALLDTQKRAWLLEDGAQLVAARLQPIAQELLWQSIKQAWRLSAQQAAVLQQLCIWRDQLARQHDIPRNHVLRESTLIALAIQQPDNLTQLAQIEAIRPQVVRRHGSSLLQCLTRAKALPESAWPQPLPEPLPVEAGKQLKYLRAMVNKLAEQLGMAHELLLKKKVLEDLLRSGYPYGSWQIPDSLTGWRRTLLADFLLERLEQTIV